MPAYSDLVVQPAGGSPSYVRPVRIWADPTDDPLKIADAINATDNGIRVHRLLAAAGNNLTSVKATAGRVVGGMVSNTAAAARFFKLYNKASAPVVASDVPVATMVIPAGASIAIGAVFGAGLFFSNGIAFALTTGVADTDAGALVANDVVINLLYV